MRCQPNMSSSIFSSRLHDFPLSTCYSLQRILRLIYWVLPDLDLLIYWAQHNPKFCSYPIYLMPILLSLHYFDAVIGSQIVEHITQAVLLTVTSVSHELDHAWISTNWASEAFQSFGKGTSRCIEHSLGTSIYSDLTMSVSRDPSRCTFLVAENSLNEFHLQWCGTMWSPSFSIWPPVQ